MPYHTLHHAASHCGWDNALTPNLQAAPGDTIDLHIRDASNHQITPHSTHHDVANLDTSLANPTTGPIYIDDAQPGHTLIIDILDFQPSGWGWTALIPGFGLLADQFPDPFLHLSQYDNDTIHFTPDIQLPTRPFPGTIGLAPAEPGHHSVIPPRNVGGNLDTRDLVTGSRLYLPVAVPGALLSIGDTHAAQGDGEVCGTAVESPMSLRIKINLDKNTTIPRPRMDVPRHAARTPSDPGYHITTGIAPDLHTAARQAVADMIDLLSHQYRLDPPLAYCLCSTAADLRISECVNMPNFLVSARLPRSIFT